MDELEENWYEIDRSLAFTLVLSYECSFLGNLLEQLRQERLSESNTESYAYYSETVSGKFDSQPL